ncbi:MAG: CHASE2 domain-containing protein, partial [Paracoccaceae bacterium]
MSPVDSPDAARPGRPGRRRGPTWRDARRFASARLLLGLVIVAAVSLAAVAGFRDTQALRSLEAGLNDRLRVILSPKSEAQDPRITILTVTEDTLALFPYRSPVDRDFLARLIDLLGEAGVRGIAVDVLIDQATEPEKDAALIAAMRRFDGPLILAWADARAGLRPQQEAFLEAFTEESGATPGFATVRYDDDGVVRRFESSLEGTEVRSLPAAMLEATGLRTTPEAGLIDWRRETEDGATTFQLLPSHTLLNPALPAAMFE